MTFKWLSVVPVFFRRCHAHQRNLHGLILPNLWIKYGEVKIWRPFAIAQIWLWYRKLKSIWKYTIYRGWPIDWNLFDQSITEQDSLISKVCAPTFGRHNDFKTSWDIKAWGQNMQNALDLNLSHFDIATETSKSCTFDSLTVQWSIEYL